MTPINYLFPNAIENFVNRGLKKLSHKTKNKLRKKLCLWLGQNPDNAVAVDKLPNCAPTWAIELFPTQTIHDFVASEKSRKQFNQLAAFLLELERFRCNPAHPALSTKAAQILAKLERESIQSLQEKRLSWLELPGRGKALKAIGSDGHITTVSENLFWHECQSLKELHHFGQKLGGNCLTSGYYDNAFINSESSGFRCFALSDSTNQVLAAAAFEFGELLDFEGKGNNGGIRFKAASKHSDALYQLITHHNFTVVLDDDRIRQTGIYEQTRLDTPIVDCNDLQCWHDIKHCRLIISVDSGYADIRYYHDIPLAGHSEANYPAQLGRYMSEFGYDNTLCNLLGKALSDAASRGELAPDVLAHFEEFSQSGVFWREDISYRISANTKIGRFIFTGYSQGTIWWESEPNTVHRLQPNGQIPQEIEDDFYTKLSQEYKHQGHFWNCLAEQGLYFPNLRTNQFDEPVLSYCTYARESLGPEKGWVKHPEFSSSRYSIQSRLVDDNEGTETTQWVCIKDESHPVCGLVVRQLSPLRKQFHIQAPGRDPKAYRALMDAIPKTNKYSEWITEDHHFFNGMSLGYLYLTRNGQPIEPQNKLTNSEYSTTLFENRQYFFDGKDRIALILSFNRQNQIANGIILGDPEHISPQLPTLFSQLSLTANDSFAGVADDLGYLVEDGRLIAKPKQPDFSDLEVDVQLDGTSAIIELPWLITDSDLDEDDIDFIDDFDFPDELELTIHDQQLACNINICQSLPFRRDIALAVSRIADYFRVSIPKDLQKVFALQAHNDSYKITDLSWPSEWTCIGNKGHYVWLLDDQINEPAIKVINGEVHCPLEDLQRLSEAQEKLRQFTDWYNA